MSSRDLALVQSGGARSASTLVPVQPLASVLMSTYGGETPANLAASLESLCLQTVAPDEVVLVVDGAIDAGQEAVIDRFAADRRLGRLVVVRLAANGGLAAALNAGLCRCVGRYTLRMDSDDLCLSDRIELQLRYADSHPEIDVVSSWSEEFFEDGAVQLKVSPVSHDAVARALRWRNVLVHPTIMIRTETLRRVGGYRTRYARLEDYDLFVRLVLAGATFHVIPKVLVRVRSSIAQRTRRGGFRYFLDELRFRSECFRSGFLTARQYIALTALYSIFRLLSGPLRRRAYALARS